MKRFLPILFEVTIWYSTKTGYRYATLISSFKSLFQRQLKTQLLQLNKDYKVIASNAVALFQVISVGTYI